MSNAPRRPFFLAVVLLACATLRGGLFAAPPTDAQVDAAVKSYTEHEQQAMSANGEIAGADRVKWADSAMAQLDATALTPTQIEKLIRARVLPLASCSRDVADQLGRLAQADTVDGADAAALRLSFLSFEPDVSAQQQMIWRALTHPSLHDALMQGKAYTLFGNLRYAGKNLLQEVLSLEKILSPEMPPPIAARAYLVVDTIVALTDDDDVAAREPMREKALEMVRAAAKQKIDDPILRDALTNSEAKLDGAFLKGKLVGYPAPQLDIIWTNIQPPITSLTELQGKVVVLDFWATWCGPCIAAFPDIRELQHRYENFPVVILGVTSLQGFHVAGPRLDADGKVIEETRSIDCKDDPAKEMALMSDFIKERNVTWKIAFTKQNVFNPQYGVGGIPHVVIIDPKGIVRYRKLHPNSKVVPFAEKVSKIDGLLKEAGLPCPPPLPDKK